VLLATGTLNVLLCQSSAEITVPHSRMVSVHVS